MSEAVEQAVRVRRAGATRRRLHRLDAVVSPYLYVGSFFVVFCAFGLFPLGYTAWMSLTDRNLLNPTTHFVGLDNYTALIHDSYFWNAVENTLGIWVLSTVPQLLLALVFAHFLNTRLRARTFFRMSVLLPQVTSVVAVALIFTQLFSRDYGLFNWMLGGIGISPVDWEAGRFSSWAAISAMVTWRWTGYNALIYLGAMQAIPKDLYEAAAIDRAGPWRQLWHITLPALRPTIAFTALMSLIGQMQLFTEPLLFDTSPGSVSGGSARQFQTMALFMYEEGFRLGHLGYGAAVSWLLIVMTFVLAAVGYVITRRAVGEKAAP